MSYRLQVLIPPSLDAQLRKAAQRSRVSKGAWVRRALEESLRGTSADRSGTDPVARLAAIKAPTPDIEQMLAEIEAGRR
jgi:hypothetical protein